MKEATGELNATVFIVMVVGVLLAFFYYAVWPSIRNNFEATTQCNKAVCKKCDGGAKKCDYVTCYPKGEYGNEGRAFQCIYKG